MATPRAKVKAVKANWPWPDPMEFRIRKGAMVEGWEGWDTARMDTPGATSVLILTPRPRKGKR